jgi:hypothetical protein
MLFTYGLQPQIKKEELSEVAELVSREKRDVSIFVRNGQITKTERLSSKY